jgi:hypothetical protein
MAEQQALANPVGLFARDFALGWTIFAALQTATCPFQRIKMLVAPPGTKTSIHLRPGAEIFGYVRNLRAEHGWGYFWRYNLARVLRNGPVQGSALAFNDLYKRLLLSPAKMTMAAAAADDDDDGAKRRRTATATTPKTRFSVRRFSAHLLAGGMAGATTLLLFAPLDQARLMVAWRRYEGQFRGVADCLAKTVWHRGVRELYAPGTAVAVASAFVFRAGQLGLYGSAMECWNPYHDDTGTKGLASAVAVGVAARTVTIPFTYPLDTVRRRMMLESDVPAEKRQFKSTLDCARQLVAQEGVKRGLYQAFCPELFRGFGGIAVVVLYDRWASNFKRLSTTQL